MSEVLDSDQDVPLGLALPVALVMTLPLALRRLAPVAVAALVVGAHLVQGLAGEWELTPQSELLALAMAFFALGAHARDPHALWAVAAALGAVLAHEPGDFIVQGPLMAGVFAAGRLMRSRTELARTLARDRAAGERQAVAEERARIARELHDVVAHSISLMVVQAGAERLAVGRERPQTAEVLEEMERTGRQALAEMRRLLGMLRRSDAELALAPQPSLANVDELAERLRGAGLPVELVVEGRPRALPPGIDISGYRIVQEALTNALKHAGPARVCVRIAYGADAVDIEVADDGRGGSAPAGHGLTGMRERVSVFGGELAAGSRPEGGWTLRARLPLGAEP